MKYSSSITQIIGNHIIGSRRKLSESLKKTAAVGALATGLVLSVLSPAHANTELYWDANGATAGTGGTGTWSTSTSLWRLGSDTGTLQTWTNTTSSDLTAHLAGTAGTVTIASSTSIYVNNLSFDVTGYTISSGNSTALLYLSGTSPVITLGSNTATIAGSLRVADGSVATVAGSGGTLYMTTNDFRIGGAGANSSAVLDLSGVSNFVYNGTGKSFIVSGLNSTVAGTSSGTVTLSANTSITATSISVGTINAASTVSTNLNTGTLNLGASTTMVADQISVGTGRASGSMQFTASGGALTISGLTTERVDIRVGYQSGSGTVGSAVGIIDTTLGTLTATVGSLIIAETGVNASRLSTGTFSMGLGTLDATEIVLARRAGQNLSPSATFNLNGGTVKVQTMTFADNLNANTQGISGTFNLISGNLYFQTIQAGASNQATGYTNTRSINWTSGTIHNYDSSTDATMSGVTVTATTSGTHSFSVDSGRKLTVDSTATLSGNGAVTKDGTGTLILEGVNTYTGATTVNAGTLLVNSSLATGSTVTVNNTGTLGGHGAVNTVNVLSGGTINAGLAGTFSTGALSIASGGNVAATLTGTTAGTGFDQVSVTGSVNLNSNSGAGSNLLLTLSYVPVYNDSFTLILNDGTDAISGTFATINGVAFGEGNTFSLTYNSVSYEFSLSYTGGDGNDLVVTSLAVPEPSSILLLGFGVMGTLYFARRRKMA